MHQGLASAAADVAVEGMMPPFDGATTWLNSPLLTQCGLPGRVVFVQFWTYIERRLPEVPPDPSDVSNYPSELDSVRLVHGHRAVFPLMPSWRQILGLGQGCAGSYVHAGSGPR